MSKDKTLSKKIVNLSKNKKFYIHAAFLKELRLDVGTPLEVQIKAGKLVVRPISVQEAKEAGHTLYTPKTQKKKGANKHGK